jgi:hypothetical protein
MENNQKPEWFELADNDRAVIRPSKKKSGPIRSLTLILAGVLVIPMGAGFALLSHENHSATAAGTLNLTQDSPAANSSTPALPVNTITMPALSREDDDESEDGDDDRAPVFANSVNTSPTPLVQPAPSAVTNVPVAKTTAAITPPGTSSASNELILPHTKKADDDDDEEDEKKNSYGKKSKKSERDDDDDEEDYD